MWKRIKKNNSILYYNEELEYIIHKALDDSCWVIEDNDGHIIGISNKLSLAKEKSEKIRRV